MDPKRPPHNGKKQRRSPFFTITEEPCVWMKAEVVNFKLCDQTRDCSLCAFDRAMKEAWNQLPEPRDTTGAGPPESDT